MLHRRAEYNRTLVLHVVQPGIHNELIALGHANLHIQIADVVLDAVEAHLSHVDVGMDADAANRNQGADLHGGLDIQLVGCVLENLQDIYIVRPLRCGCKPQRKLRLEIGQHPLICICRSVVRLVDDQIVESVLPELIQIQCNALDAAAYYMGVRLFEVVRKLADSHFRPQVAEGVVSLVDQLHCVRHEQHPAAAAFGVHDCGDGFACTCCMV